MDVNHFSLTLHFKSGLASALQADTWFGHICWAIRYSSGNGAKKLRNFLSLYDTGSPPPLLVSDGFPNGTLPRPIVEPVGQKDIDVIFKSGASRMENAYKIKNAQRMPFISRKIMHLLQQEGLSSMRLLSLIRDDYEELEKIGRRQSVQFVKHCVIDRSTGRAEEGGLFAQKVTFFDPEQSGDVYDLYVKTSFFSKSQIEDLFGWIGFQGFGQDKSSGKGHFECEVREDNQVPSCPNPNGFMTLSSFIPTPDDPNDGCYNLLHKFGKLGGDYAKGSPAVNGNPFKKPLLMFSAGSTFSDDNFHEEKKYGDLLKEVHVNQAIRHYALAFPVGIHLKK